MDLVYPVGSVYVAYNSTTPATRFGGTWTAITGRFPYFNAGTGTGGANTVTLTVDQMPYHSHNSNDGANWGINVGAYGKGYIQHPGWTAADAGSWVENTDPWRGGGKAHNNMPAYQTLYAWRRTA